MSEEVSITNDYLDLWKAWGIDTPLENTRLGKNQKNKVKPVMVPRKPVVLSATPIEIKKPAKLKTLEDVSNWIGDCKRCGLCKERNKIVLGSGNPNARLMFIGEAPGADEDKQGLPFVGRAGQLLTKIIEAMGYQRDEFYIANVIKCRPPGNRAPLPEEIEQCVPFLKSQIEIIQPDYVVALGLYAATLVTGQAIGISNLRGRFHPLAWDPTIQVMPTYHPAYLLRNPAAKKMVWDDMKKVKEKLDKTQ